MDAEQAYLFDLNGFIVLENVLEPSAVASLLATNRDMQRRGEGKTVTLHWDKSYRDLLARLYELGDEVIFVRGCTPVYIFDGSSLYANMYAGWSTYDSTARKGMDGGRRSRPSARSSERCAGVASGWITSASTAAALAILRTRAASCTGTTTSSPAGATDFSSTATGSS
jgi:hypothetical protein